MGLPRIATVWLGGCAGCHMSFLDLDEFLIDLASQVEIVFSPVLDIKEYPDNVDICLVEGVVCNEDHVEMAHKIRLRSKLVVSLGDCAVTGNVPAIRNRLGASGVDSVLHRAYIEAAQFNPCLPEERGIVPALLSRVMPLHEVVHVDCYIPGCPPSAARIKSFLTRALMGGAMASGPGDIKFG